MKHGFDVVIVGAGIAGIATAYYLATKHNITNVLLVDKRPPMTYTSDKSGSNYRNWWPHPAMAQLANHSIDLMDALAVQTNNIFNMNRRGYAYFSRNDDLESYLSAYAQSDVGEIRIHRDAANSYQPEENPDLTGADVLVGNELIKQYAPFVSDDIQSMVHCRRAGWISTRVMAQHMLDVVTQMGVVEIRGEVTQVDQTSITIKTPYDTQAIQTNKLLFAVGPNLPHRLNWLELDLSLTNVFHQKVMLRDKGKILPDGMPFMIFMDSPTGEWTDEELDYLHAHAQSEQIPGNFHIRRVNPDWIHLGWAFNCQESNELDPSHFEPLYPKVALKGISSFIPSLQSFAQNIPQPIIVSGGFYTQTPENLPIIQQTASGVYVIGALSGFGVMVGCGVGDIMSDMIAGHTVPDYVRQFSASRYNNPDYVKQIESMRSGEL